MKRHLSDSEPENCDDYDECSSPDTVQISRKKRRGIIEKRRRDRINNCLVELRRLVPAAFEKQGSAKLEKAEILQMTVDHLRHLQSRDPRGFSDPYSPYGNTRAFLDYGIMGFRECTAEIARYLTNVEGVDTKDPLRTRVLAHLENLLSQKELTINAAVAANSQLNMPKVGVPIQTPVSVVSMPTMPAVSIPYAPLTPPRASPDNLSPPANFPTGAAAPEPLPRFSVAFPFPSTPIISLAPTSGSVPAVFRPATATTGPHSGFKPVIPIVQQPTAAPISVVKPAPVVNGSIPASQPLTVITNNTTANMAGNLSPVSPPFDQNNTMRIETTSSISTLLNSPTKTLNSSTKAPFRPWADSMTVTNNA